MYKEIEIPLANGYTIVIDSANGITYASLKNPNGFIVSDKELNEDDKKTIKEIVS